jgi:hypothetical protein
VVAKISAPLTLLSTPMHAEVVGHEIWNSVVDAVVSPAGRDWLCQVAPPSVVPTMKGVEGLAFVEPIASQTKVDAHETVERPSTPEGRL